MLFFQRKRLCLIATLTGLALLCLVSGCASKKTSFFPDPIKQIRQNKAILPETGEYVEEADAEPFSNAELDALASTGEIDRHVSPEEMQEVARFFRYYVHTGRAAFTRTLERVQIYAPYVQEVLREKNMPQELAWLAIVESGYRTQVESSSRAKGMWQFMPYTGKRYGLEQNWWIDERCDFYKSSYAATEYLGFLYGKFDDWHLAIAAYNAGEGKIEKALQGTGTDSFAALKKKNHQLSEKAQLRDETKQYVPRFLAVCKIMRNLEKLGFEPIKTEKTASLARVELKPATDLVALSRALDIPWTDFQEQNGAFKRHVSPPEKTSVVYVPSHKKQIVRQFMCTANRKSGPGWKTYTVAKGDTLQRISSKTGVPVDELRKLSGISRKPARGTRLAIPGGTSASSSMLADNTGRTRKRTTSSQAEYAPGKARTSAAKTSRSNENGQTVYHVVQSGDTLYNICQRYNVRLDDLTENNNLAHTTIKCGQKLEISRAMPQKTVQRAEKAPRQTRKLSSTVASTPSSKRTAQKTKQYRVQSGDTMWAIARKFNISAPDLIKLNNMGTSSNLKPGDIIMIVER